MDSGIASIRILVVDDEPVIRWAIEQTLTSAGFDVVAAGTIAEGSRLFEELAPQVVFLDVRLPDGDGLSLLQDIKRRRGCESTVIVMTAFSESASAEDAKRLGAFDYLDKPFRFDILPALARRALDARHP